MIILFFFGNVLIFMKSGHFQRANKPTKNSHWGVAWSSYHGTFYSCSAFWAPLIKEICLFWKFLWNATIFQDRTVVGDWRVAEAVSWDFGGSRATIWGGSFGLGPTQELGGRGWVMEDILWTRNKNTGNWGRTRIEEKEQEARGGHDSKHLLIE